MEREPDWMALPAQVPESIRRLLTHCLQKDPANRLHDIADARIEIAEALSTPGSDRKAETRVLPRARMIAAALAVAALALAVMWWRLPPPSTSRALPAEAMEFGVTFPNNFMTASGVAVSPDGRQIAANVWSNVGDIWVYSLDGSRPRPLPGGGWKPRTTPASTIAFFRGDQLVTMKASGGPLTSIARPRPTGIGFAGGSWNRDGVIPLPQVATPSVRSLGAGAHRSPLAGVTG
jgi:hypothetical protein